MQNTPLNIEMLLDKFSKINFNERDGKKFTRGDWTLHYEITMSEILGLQIIFRLYYRDHIVQNWGCVDEDNMKAIKWIKRKEQDIFETEMLVERNAEKIGKELFAEL